MSSLFFKLSLNHIKHTLAFYDGEIVLERIRYKIYGALDIIISEQHVAVSLLTVLK